jgi:hypothetical protein
MAHPETNLLGSRSKNGPANGVRVLVRVVGVDSNNVVSASPNAGSTDRNRGLGAVRRFRMFFRSSIFERPPPDITSFAYMIAG